MRWHGELKLKAAKRPNRTQLMIEPILVVAIVIICTAWYVRHRLRRRARIRALQQGSGLDVLARRYARGEIDRDEFLQKRGDILGYQLIPESQIVSQSHP